MKNVFAIILLLTSVFFAQEKALTLEESIKLGLENNNALTISRSKITEAEAKSDEIGSMLMPKLSVGATYARLSDVPPFEVNLPAMPAPIKIQDAILNNYSLKASVQQPLFTGFRLSSLNNAAKMQKAASEENYNAELNNITLEISTAFWNVYRANKIYELTKKIVKRAKAHLTDTENFLDNGLVTKSDYLKIKVLYSNSMVAEVEAKNNLMVATAVFNKTIGLDLGAETKIYTEDLWIEESSFELESILKEGLTNRHEIKSFNFLLNATEENITAANSGWYPNVALFGNLYYSNPTQRIMPLEDKFNDTWDVGVSLNWNIWDWGETSAKSTQAKQLKIQTEAALKTIEDNIHLEIYSAYLNIKKESDKVELNQLAYDQSEENLRIVKDQYSAQLASSSDLIDAETSLLDAETKLISARIDYEIARLKLEKAIGRKIY